MIAVAVFGAIMAMLLAAVVIAPLVEEGRRSRPGPGDEASIRLERALEALRRLQFEYETGKLDDEDYAAMRSEHAAAALAARDELASREPGEAAAPGASGASGAAVEVPSCEICGSVLDSSVQYCTHCGNPVPQPSAGSGITDD
ncbi:MAG: hypothetical protein ABFS14_02650 [Gemmatimonadota bacterium]